MANQLGDEGKRGKGKEKRKLAWVVSAAQRALTHPERRLMLPGLAATTCSLKHSRQWLKTNTLPPDRV